MSRFLWSQIEDIGPSARFGHAMAYDFVRSRSTLSGRLGQTTNDESAGKRRRPRSFQALISCSASSSFCASVARRAAASFSATWRCELTSKAVLASFCTFYILIRLLECIFGRTAVKSSSSLLGRGTKAFSLLVAAGLVWGFLSVTAFSQQPTVPPAAATAPAQVPSPEERQKREEWQRSMSQIPVPKKGCFNSSYPSLEWHEVPCGPPSIYPNPPAKGPRPDIVGNGNDIAATVSGPMISSATGTFDSVTPANVTVSGPWGGNPNAANAFTLQINSQFFDTPACNGVAGCRGWQQFIYSQNQCNGPCVFMEYWLISYGPSCPPGSWMQSGNSCWFNSASKSAPAVTAAQLQGTTLTGTAGTTTDTVVLISPNGTATATGADSVVSLAQQWNTAEFNIFGDCCSSQTNFSANTTIVTRTRVVNGTTAKPTCVAQGFTGETNNLSFGPSAPAASPPGPAVIFTASSAGGSPSNCAAATTVGDTHLTTFDGLLYDFQASGDFILAKTGPDFVVQTRQISGAPNWPNAAINKAVATQMGNSSVAICLQAPPAPEKLYVDGKTRTVVNGKPLSLDDGVNISKNSNVYVISDPNGNSVRAQLNVSYIDVSVRLGRWPTKAYGLLANANGNVNRLEGRDGRSITNQFSFEQLYQQYGTSWRVFDDELLLTVCGENPRGNPSNWFFAKDLDPAVSNATKAVCEARGVARGPILDACTLDVAVIGQNSAAEVFSNMPAPVAVGQPHP